MAESSVRASLLHVRFSEFELDEANARVLRDGRAVALSPTLFGLLCALVRHRGTLLTKHALLAEVWGQATNDDRAAPGMLVAQLSQGAETPALTKAKVVLER